MTQHFVVPVLPAALTSLRNWLVWRLVLKEGQKKPSKIPYYASGAARPGTQGTPEDRALMVTFDEAVACVQRSQSWERPYTGIGFAPHSDSGIVALDFDDCVEDGVIAAHVEALCEGTYTEFSPSGRGVRSFFAGSLISRKDVDAKLGPYPIEVFGHNGFVTVTGNVTPTCEMFGWNEHVAHCSAGVYEMYRARGWDSTQRHGETNIDAFAALVPTVGLSAADVAMVLIDLPADLDYDSWVKVGMAVHHETGGAGFDLWHNWSKASPKYTTEDYCRGRWASFGRYTGGSHITMAWVKKLAADSQAHRKYEAAKELKQRIAETSDEFILREKMCPMICADSRIGDMEREALAQALFERFKALGTKYPIAQCRRLIAEKKPQRDDGGANLPEWLAGWLYVTDEDKFYKINTEEWLTKQAFNAKYNVLQPKNDAGAVVTNASEVALDEWGIKVVTRGMYLPYAQSTFTESGVDCVNTFRPSSMPQAVAVIDADGRVAVDLFVRHVQLVAGAREDIARTIIDWLAHQVQRPGIKVRWSPLIKGIAGDGKTILGNVMSAVLGRPNVKQISPKVLGTDFTDWAHGACVGILEELKLTGHNRHDIFNALKPYITNDDVPVHPKGRAERNVKNTVNYMGFTNHNDALPIDDTDRRWMVVFTPFTSKEDLLVAVRALGCVDVAAYFDELHAAIHSHPAALRRFFLDWPISHSFNPNGSAPETPERAHMIGMTMSQEEEVVREVIAAGAQGVGSNVLSSTCLVEACMVADASASLQTNTLNRLLSKMGWTKVPSEKVKWKGRTHRIWTRGKVPNSNEDLRRALDATAGGEADLASETAAAVDLFR